jgi:hypothetical protein
MDSNQRQKVTKQLLKIVTDPEKKRLAKDLFCEQGDEITAADEPKVKKGGQGAKEIGLLSFCAGS